MSDAPRDGWEPNRNAVHRLILFLDVMAIAFNRFRRLSMRLPVEQPNEQFDTPAWMEGLTRLKADYNAIKNAISPPAEYSTGTRAQRLLDEAIAYFALAGAKDDGTRTAVANVANWLNPLLIAWLNPAPRPWNFYSAVVEADGVTRIGNRFDEEGEWWNHYRPMRRALITALSGIGQTLPHHIDHRERLAFSQWRKDEPDPITQNDLLALVAESALIPPAGTESKISTSSKRKGNKPHSESKDPKRQRKANLYDHIVKEKRDGEGAKSLAERLKNNRDLVGLAKDAGIEVINKDVVEAALEHNRRKERRTTES